MRPIDFMHGWDPAWPAMFQRLTKLKSKAIISDIASSPERIKEDHVKGINVLYANGVPEVDRLQGRQGLR